MYRMSAMVNRREFVIAVAGSAAPLSQLERFTRGGPAQRAIVIGGGLAGLCTAYELQGFGHRATVLEAQKCVLAAASGHYASRSRRASTSRPAPSRFEVRMRSRSTTRARSALRCCRTARWGTRLLYYVRGQRIVNTDVQCGRWR